MFFTREALEQATPEEVARYRASRLADFSRIFDLGCGIGGDSLTLARIGHVTAIDREMDRLTLLSMNAKALGRTEQIQPIQADLQWLGMRFPPAAAGFFDPDRRIQHRRLHSVLDYIPPLCIVEEWIPKFAILAVKVSPAIHLEEIVKYDCEVEFVSWRGQLKEATLWFNEGKTALLRATILPGPHTMIGEGSHPPNIASPGAYIFEPDPAVLRARLVRTLGLQIGAAQIDPEIALLTSDQRTKTPFARSFKVLEIVPFGLKRLRSALRSMEVGKLTLKKRGSAVDVETFVRQLKLRGSNEATVILTRAQGRKIALIVEPE
jgi:hypothetical protein